MFKLLQKWFGGAKKTAPEAHERVLQLERDIQGLRLELGERHREIERLRADLERQRRMERAVVEQAVQEATERLLSDAAAPVTQLLTQAHLVEKEGKPVAARDILVVARRLVRVLEGHGLQIEGRAGERTAFDPNRHQFLAAAAATATPDQPVVVRFPAALFQGKVLLKAGVEPLEE